MQPSKQVHTIRITREDIEAAYHTEGTIALAVWNSRADVLKSFTEKARKGLLNHEEQEQQKTLAQAYLDAAAKPHDELEAELIEQLKSPDGTMGLYTTLALKMRLHLAFKLRTNEQYRNLVRGFIFAASRNSVDNVTKKMALRQRIA